MDELKLIYRLTRALVIRQVKGLWQNLTPWGIARCKYCDYTCRGLFKQRHMAKHRASRHLAEIILELVPVVAVTGIIAGVLRSVTRMSKGKGNRGGGNSTGAGEDTEA